MFSLLNEAVGPHIWTRSEVFVPEGFLYLFDSKGLFERLEAYIVRWPFNLPRAFRTRASTPLSSEGPCTRIAMIPHMLQGGFKRLWNRVLISWEFGCFSKCFFCSGGIIRNNHCSRLAFLHPPMHVH